MNIARLVTESPPSIRWRLSSLYTRLIYKSAFAAIGRGSVIVRPLRLRGVNNIYIGRDCAIYEDSWLETEQDGVLKIEDNVYLGHRVHLHAVANITIGRGTMITDGALISSGSHDVHDSMRALAAEPIVIGDGCFIGQSVIILGGVTIGAKAIIGAGAVVTSDIPAGATAVGIPARVIRK